MEQMDPTKSLTANEPAYFPPISARDWAGMTYGTPTAINPNAARMVYDVCWFILKDGEAAIRVTKITFAIALHRFSQQKMPEPAAYTSWLTAIASNEAHRLLEQDRSLRHSSALLEADSDRPAHFLADALSELRIEHKLLLILRYRFNTSPEFLSKSLDLRPRRIAQMLDDARKGFREHSSHSPRMLAGTHPPLNLALPTHATPYTDKQMRRSHLGYDWLKSDYPLIPERDEVRTKWITFALTVLIVCILAAILTNPFGAERPTLIDPTAPAEVIDG